MLSSGISDTINAANGGWKRCKICLKSEDCLAEVTSSPKELANAERCFIHK